MVFHFDKMADQPPAKPAAKKQSTKAPAKGQGAKSVSKSKGKSRKGAKPLKDHHKVKYEMNRDLSLGPIYMRPIYT